MVEIVREEQGDEIYSFLQRNFLPRAEALVYLNRCDPTPLKTKEEEYEECRVRTHNMIRKSLSLAVRHSGELVAVVLNRMETLTDKEFPQDDSSEESLIGSFFTELSEGVDLFSEFKTDNIFYLYILSVREDFGRLGLAKKLIQLTIELASTTNAGAIQVEATSEYSAKPMAQLGFRTFKEIDYAKFEYRGKRPLENIPELVHLHPTARLMARRIP